jgi:phage shock protein A
MGIFDRMGRVISSNFNALLDQAEDPAKSLAQTLSEMQTQLRLAKTELVRAVAAERQLRRKVEDIDAEQERWAKRAELAVQHGDDSLAREALRQRKRLETERARTEELRGQQRGNALEMKTAWEGMQSKFRDFSARKSTIATRAAQAKHGGGATALGGSGEAFAEFAAIEDRIEGVDDVLDAQREVDQMLAVGGSPAGLTKSEVEARFAELEGQRGTEGAEAVVDDELQELKQRLRVRIE